MSPTSTAPVTAPARPAPPNDPSVVSPPLRLALVNDYEIIVRGLHAMLEPFSSRVVIVEHDIASTPDASVDIALFDTFAAHRDSISRSIEMRHEGRADHVVLYTWDASPSFLDAARAAGVSAVLRKSLTGARLVRALERVVRGDEIEADELTGDIDTDQQPLTLREREVLALIALGLTNAEIGDELFVSTDTVKTHVRRLYRKLGVRNRTEAAVLAREHQLSPPPVRVQRLAGAQRSTT